MNRPTNIALLVVVALAAVVAERTFVRHGPVQSQIQAALATPATEGLEGRVLSVDPLVSGGEASLARKALVKLRTGETVSASIGGCVVLPGQTTRLLRYGSGSSAYFVVAENGRNDG